MIKTRISNGRRRIRRWLRWYRRSLVADSTVKILAVGLCLALLFSGASMGLIRQHETRRLMGHVDELLSTVESAVRVACFTGDTTLATDIAHGLLTNHLIAEVKISSGNETLALVNRHVDGAIDLKMVRRTVLSPFGSGEIVGQIELGADLDVIRAQAAEYSLLSAAVLMLEVIAVAGAVALVMMRRVVRPIKILSGRTHGIQIINGEHVSAPEGHADNEIGKLANDFNLMIDNMNDLLAIEQTMRAAIEENERRFRTLVENTPDIIARYDRDCRYIFVNRAFCRETGHSCDQVLNKKPGDVCAWTADMQAEEYRDRLSAVMESGVPDQILLEWQRSDGRWVSHEMYVVAEYDAEGQVTGALAIGRDVTERKAVERQMLHQASYDALTELPNRRLFNDRLREEIAKAERHGQSLALLFIDLDRFKEVNDTLGHAIGDQLLIEASLRLSECVRETDTVARLAGDEFVILIAEIDSFDVLERIAQSIVTSISRPFHFWEQSAFVSASIGIARYPLDADRGEALLGCADQAMYRAKEAGRNNYRFFTGNMLEHAQQRMQLAADLREAMTLGQLEVHYQPIVEIASGEVVKAEALVRWHHPRLGFVPPDQFVPIAEETGLIMELGIWVFARAADFARRWNQATNHGPFRQVNINISPRQFTKSDIAEWVLDYLYDHGIDPAYIVVEITEGLLLADNADVTGQLKRLRDGGIGISLDDFGTGYSAMAYLKKFNIDYLKIDRSFIRDLEIDSGDRAIAEAIVVMAHRLGLKVVAEGVETQGQIDLLAAVGCEYLQGYYFAKPMPADGFFAYVDSLHSVAASGTVDEIEMG